MFIFSGKSLPSSFGIGSGVGSPASSSRSGGAVVVWMRFNNPASCGICSSSFISSRPSPTKESPLVRQFVTLHLNHELKTVTPVFRLSPLMCLRSRCGESEMLTSSGQSSDRIDPRRLGLRLTVSAADSILRGSLRGRSA